MKKNNVPADARKYIISLYEHPEKLGWLLGYKKITRVHGEWIKTIHEAKEDLTFQSHRGSYKTTALTVCGIIWALFFFPDRRYLVASSTETNADKIVAEISKQYHNTALIALYNLINVDSAVDKSTWRRTSFTLTTRKKSFKEASVESIGVGGIVTSRHYDRIICDDIVTIKDRTSAAERRTKKNWIKELQSIIDPHGVIAYIGTPWHISDIYSITPTAVKWPVGSILIEGLDDKKLAKIRKMQGESFYSAQYLLEHTSDEDKIFDNPTFGELHGNTNVAMFAYLDPALGGKDSSAIVIGCKHVNKYYIVYANKWNTHIDKTYDKTVALCTQYNVRTLYAESNAAQKLIIDEFNRRKVNTKGVNHSKNKHLRIMDGVLKHWESINWSKRCNDQFLNEVLEYTETSTRDDCPDAVAGFTEIFDKNTLGQIKMPRRQIAF